MDLFLLAFFMLKKRLKIVDLIYYSFVCIMRVIENQECKHYILYNSMQQVIKMTLT